MSSRGMNHSAPPPPAAAPRGMTAIGVFFLFGAAMAIIAGITLMRPGTALDHMWSLNPRAYRDLAPFGKSVGVLFLFLAISLLLAGLGWLKRQLWGWRLSVVIVGIQVLGNLAGIFLGRAVEGVVGFTIAGALLLYMVRPEVSGSFAAKPKQIVRTNGP